MAQLSFQQHFWSENTEMDISPNQEEINPNYPESQRAAEVNHDRQN